MLRRNELDHPLILVHMVSFHLFFWSGIFSKILIHGVYDGQVKDSLIYQFFTVLSSLKPGQDSSCPQGPLSIWISLCKVLATNFHQ